MKTIALSLFLSSGTAAFAPNAFGRSQPTTTALHVSVVRDLINKKASKTSVEQDEDLLHVFETETPVSVGVQAPGIQEPKRTQVPSKKKNRRRRKHNYGQQKHLQDEPDLDFFTLHSSAVSHLHKDMPINDIVRAIKRAQNLHDVHDLATINGFLTQHCDENWGFGYRGSLLSRLAVAALHCNQLEIAIQAIDTRRTFERPSMQPHESAAIVRGLMRIGEIERGWEVLEDELRLPMDGLKMDNDASQELLKHRARALASIASRFFYQGEPHVAAKALGELGTLGSVIDKAHMAEGSLGMPWEKLVAAATQCQRTMEKKTIPSDLTELVFDAMNRFPCPADEEECSLEDYLSM